MQGFVAEVKEKASQMKEEGVTRTAPNSVAAQGFGNALFEYDEDKMIQVIEEFYPATANGGSLGTSSVASKLMTGIASTSPVSR